MSDYGETLAKKTLAGQLSRSDACQTFLGVVTAVAALARIHLHSVDGDDTRPLIFLGAAGITRTLVSPYLAPMSGTLEAIFEKNLTVQTESDQPVVDDQGRPVIADADQAAFLNGVDAVLDELIGPDPEGGLPNLESTVPENGFRLGDLPEMAGGGALTLVAAQLVVNFAFGFE